MRRLRSAVRLKRRGSQRGELIFGGHPSPATADHSGAGQHRTTEIDSSQINGDLQHLALLPLATELTVDARNGLGCSGARSP